MRLPGRPDLLSARTMWNLTGVKAASGNSMAGRAGVIVALAGLAALAACGDLAGRGAATPGFLPAAPWDSQPQGAEWTAATMAALRAEGVTLVSSVPSDIAAYCPAYAKAGPKDRSAFWVSVIAFVAEFESGWNPAARGGGGAYKGMMQISDQTAAANGCATGKALFDPAANLSCSVRIISGHVGRDGALFGGGDQGWLGLARDWIPLRKPAVRQDIAAFTAGQPFCN